MKWFLYHQNNPSGVFHGPAYHVYVQAISERVANAMAEDAGLYFNGCADGKDCSCCGDRWSTPYRSYNEEPAPPSSYDSWESRCIAEAGAYALYLYADGTRRLVKP
jgi:hypothetical protein